jgi:methionyl-tRNA formyltransferase
MNIIFMGTPDFAVPALKALVESSHSVIAVVTGEDKERGRGRKLTYTPVKEFALENKIPVLQPKKLKDENFISRLKELNADLYVIVAFRILPVEVFTIPSKGAFNLHGSILPKYRGAAPIQWALINGDKETGVTTFMLEQKVDTGNIILQEKLEIENRDDFGTLHDKLSLLGAEVVSKTVSLIDKGGIKLLKQDDSLSSPAPKITKELTEINWNKSADNIHNLIRGLSPYPGAYFKFSDKVIKVYKSKVSKESCCPGEFIQTKHSLIIGCGKDSLNILELQQEGKKRLKIDEFLRGFSFS